MKLGPWPKRRKELAGALRASENSNRPGDMLPSSFKSHPGAAHFVLPFGGVLARMAQKVIHDRVVKKEPKRRGLPRRFTDEQVRAFRKRYYHGGETIADMARQENVSYQSFSRLVTGETYADVI